MKNSRWLILFLLLVATASGCMGGGLPIQGQQGTPTQSPVTTCAVRLDRPSDMAFSSPCTVDYKTGLYVSTTDDESTFYFMLSLLSSNAGDHEVASSLSAFFQGGNESAISYDGQQTDMLFGDVLLDANPLRVATLRLTDRRTGEVVSGTLAISH